MSLGVENTAAVSEFDRETAGKELVRLAISGEPVGRAATPDEDAGNVRSRGDEILLSPKLKLKSISSISSTSSSTGSKKKHKRSSSKENVGQDKGRRRPSQRDKRETGKDSDEESAFDSDIALTDDASNSVSDRKRNRKSHRSMQRTSSVRLRGSNEDSKSLSSVDEIDDETMEDIQLGEMEGKKKYRSKEKVGDDGGKDNEDEGEKYDKEEGGIEDGEAFDEHGNEIKGKEKEGDDEIVEEEAKRSEEEDNAKGGDRKDDMGEDDGDNKSDKESHYKSEQMLSDKIINEMEYTLRPSTFPLSYSEQIDLITEAMKRGQNYKAMRMKMPFGHNMTRESLVRNYMMKHKISELFEMFLGELITKKPASPVNFLHDMAREMNRQRQVASLGAIDPGMCPCERISQFQRLSDLPLESPPSPSAPSSSPSLPSPLHSSAVLLAASLEPSNQTASTISSPPSSTSSHS